MGVPFEALIPYAIVIAMFGASGAGLSKIRNMQNGGKRPRYNVDQWDKVGMTNVDAVRYANKLQQMMDRDRRLTGMLRGQTDQVAAPKGFELNNPWRLEPRLS